MDAATATIEYALYGRAGRTRATKMVFSPYRLFRYDDSPDELACLKTVAQRLESKSGHIALAGPDVMIEYMLKHAPELKQKVRCVLRAPHEVQKAGDLAVAAIDDLLTNVATVFICETRTHPRQSIARRIRSAADVEDWSILERLDWRDEVEVRFLAPSISLPFELSGRVQRVSLPRRRGDAGRSGMGIAFTEMSATTREILEYLLEGLPPRLPRRRAPSMRN